MRRLLILVLFASTGCGSCSGAADADPLHVQISASVTEGVAPLAVTFLGEVLDGGGTTYAAWDFDQSDGLTVDRAGHQVDFVFPDARTYIVTLSTRDASGRRGQTEVSIAVTPRSYELLTDSSVLGRPQTADEAAAMVYLGPDCSCTESAPCEIENYEIGPFAGSAIVVQGCDHVRIRNNLLHDIDFASAPSEQPQCDRNNGGLSIYVTDASDIEVSFNVVRDTMIGNVLGRAKPGAEIPYPTGNRVHDNIVERANMNYYLGGGILVVLNDDVHVFNNQVRNTGGSTLWDHRNIGVQFQGCSHVQAYGNLIDTSTSDNLSAFVSASDVGACPPNNIYDVHWSEDVHFFDNTLRRGGEQGAWMLGVIGGSIAHNFIDSPCNCGIFFEYGVSDVVVHNNVWLGATDRSHCGTPGGGGFCSLYSVDVDVFNNTFVARDEQFNGSIELYDPDPLNEWLADPGAFAFTAIPSADVFVMNNLIVDSKESGLWSALDEDQYTDAYNVKLDSTAALIDAASGFVLLPGNSAHQDTGAPETAFDDADGTRNTPGAQGGPDGSLWE